MKYFFVTCLLVTSFAKAEVVGVSSKTQLLQQLSLSLGISVAQMQLPASLTDKFPTTNSVETIASTFISALTQSTFLACTAAQKAGKIKITKTPVEAKAWIQTLAEGSWGESIGNDQVEQIYASTFSGKANPSQAHNLACSAVLSSPKIYLKAE